MPLAKSLIILALLVLYGCQSTPGDHLTRSGTNGPIYYSDIPTGATLTLLQPVVIPAEQVSTVLPRRSPGAGEYSTHCRLELWTRNPREVVVEADRFVITKVRGGLTPILVAAPKKILVASLGPGPRVAWGRDSSYLRSYAELFVKSERQPDVYRITCGYMNDPWDVDPLTIAEIREALNGIARLDLGW